jgi:hypothetical protein
VRESRGEREGGIENKVQFLSFTLLVGLTSLAAGLLGAMTGLGGGVVIVPVLALLFHVDLRYAIGASLVSVIATSSGAAAAYVREGFSNVRIGMFLEVATTVGGRLSHGNRLHPCDRHRFRRRPAFFRLVVLLEKGAARVAQTRWARSQAETRR